MVRAVCLALLAAAHIAPRAGADELLAREAVALQALGIDYGADAALPGEGVAWKMDCSNTSRFLIRRARGVELPRTAAGQYEFVRKHGRIKRAAGIFGAVPEASWWSKRLKPGDLLFWEHTYKPRSRPPVTHVMVFLGRDGIGDLLMAGAQSSHGVGIYKLRPRVSYGGHGGFFGLFRKKGRLVAYGRLPSPGG